MMGKTPMRNWQAAILVWESRSKSKSKGSGTPYPYPTPKVLPFRKPSKLSLGDIVL
jgi:hypothetical protein